MRGTIKSPAALRCYRATVGRGSRRPSSVAALALAGALLWSGCATKSTAPPPPEPQAGPTSGTVTTVTTDGSIIQLADGSVFGILSGDASRWVGQRVRVVSGGGIMINVQSGEKGESQYVGSVHRLRTYSNSGEHNQESASPGGELVLLDDGSVWSIPPSERNVTSGWAEGGGVTVEGGPHGRYRLTNGASGSTVLAAYVGEK